MNEPSDADRLSVVANVTTQILSLTFGREIQIRDIERITKEDRNAPVSRLFVDEPAAGIPASVIVKQLNLESFDWDDTEAWPVRSFVQDWAGLAFLNAIPAEQGSCPRLYGGNREHGLIVLEDLGHDHRSLVQPLLEGTCAEAEQALAALYIRLGQMHAHALGKAAMFEQTLRTIHPTMPLRWQDTFLAEARNRVESLIELEPAVWREAGQVVETISNPGPFYTYIHGDPCPDNIFYRGDKLQLIDFATGCFAHALIDAVYARMMFPTCWCANRTPDALVAQLESIYRAELAQTCLPAQDDRTYGQAIVDGCAFWLLITLEWQLHLALDSDRDWGISTFRPRVLARLQAFAAASQEFDHLPAMRGAASRLFDLLSERWPDTTPLPLYPAFRPKTNGNDGSWVDK
jgi:hypothetical protein